jgi:hypothetical protein
MADVAAKVTCPKCNAENYASDRQCPSCGAALAPPPPAQPHGSFTDALIPVKNPYALIAYYLAVFSIIPCIGIVLGVGGPSCWAFRVFPTARTDRSLRCLLAQRNAEVCVE